MTKEDVLKSYEKLLEIKDLDYSKLDLLSKVGYYSKMDALSTFKRPRIHTNFMQFMTVPDHVLKHIQKIIDGNVVIKEIDNNCIEVQYVFDDRKFIVNTTEISIN